MGLIGGLAKAGGKGLAKGGKGLARAGKGALGKAAELGKGAAGAGGAGGALGKIAQVGMAGLQAVGGPQGIMDIVSKSQEAGAQQTEQISSSVLQLLQGLQA